MSTQPVDIPTFGLFPSRGTNSADLSVVKVAVKLTCFRNLMSAGLAITYKVAPALIPSFKTGHIHYYDLKVPRFGEQLAMLRIRDHTNTVLFTAERVMQTKAKDNKDNQPIVTPNLVNCNWSGTDEYLELGVVFYHQLTSIRIGADPQTSSRASGQSQSGFQRKGYTVFLPVWVSGLLQAMGDPNIDNKVFHHLETPELRSRFILRVKLWYKSTGGSPNKIKVEKDGCTHDFRLEESRESKSNPSFSFKEYSIGQNRHDNTESTDGSGAMFRLNFFEEQEVCRITTGLPPLNSSLDRVGAFDPSTMSVDTWVQRQGKPFPNRLISISLRDIPERFASEIVPKTYIFLISLFGWSGQTERFEELKGCLLFAAKTINLTNRERILFIALRNDTDRYARIHFDHGPVLKYEATVPVLGSREYLFRFKKVAEWLNELQPVDEQLPVGSDFPERFKELIELNVPGGRRRTASEIRLYTHVITCVPYTSSLSFKNGTGNISPNHIQTRDYNHASFHLLVCCPESESDLLRYNEDRESVYRMVDDELPGIMLRCCKDDIVLEQLLKMLSMIQTGCIKYRVVPKLNEDGFTSDIFSISRYYYSSVGCQDTIELMVSSKCNSVILPVKVQVLSFDYLIRFRGEFTDVANLDQVSTTLFEHVLNVDLTRAHPEVWPQDLSGRLYHLAALQLLIKDGSNNVQSHFSQEIIRSLAGFQSWYGLSGSKRLHNISQIVQVPLQEDYSFVGYELSKLKKHLAPILFLTNHPCLLQPDPETLKHIKEWNIPWKREKDSFFKNSVYLTNMAIKSVVATYFPQILESVQYTNLSSQNIFQQATSYCELAGQHAKVEVKTQNYKFSFGFDKDGPIMKSTAYKNIFQAMQVNFLEMTVLKNNHNGCYLSRLLGNLPHKKEFVELLDAAKSHDDRFFELLDKIAVLMIQMRHVHYQEELDSFRTREVRSRMMQYLFPVEDLMNAILKDERINMYASYDSYDPEVLFGMELSMILIRCLYTTRYGGASEAYQNDFRDTPDQLYLDFERVTEWFKRAAGISCVGFRNSDSLVPFGLSPELQNHAKPHLLLSATRRELKHDEENYPQYLEKVQQAIDNKRISDRVTFLAGLVEKLQPPHIEFRFEVIYKYSTRMFNKQTGGPSTYTLADADRDTRHAIDNYVTPEDIVGH